MVIINPNAPSVSNLGSNRADGQVQSTQVDARQSQQARSPQVAQQPTATQSANAANPSQGNNDIALLNNRDRSVSDAIRRATIANDDGIANNEVAARESAALNQAQAVAPSQTLQRLADIAQANAAPAQGQNTGPSTGQTVAEAIAPEQTQAAPTQGQQVASANTAPPPASASVDFQALVNDAPAAPAVGISSGDAPAVEAPPAPQFAPPPPAFQVLQNSQQRLNDILLPDFANFIGLRASLPAQTQAEQQVDNQPTAQPRPIDVEV